MAEIDQHDDKDLKAWLTISVSPKSRQAFHDALIKLRRADPLTPISQMVVKLIIDAARQLDDPEKAQR